MPPKPEFSKGIKIYSLIATIVVVLLLLLGYGEGDGSGIAALICIAYIVPFYYCCHFFTKWCEYSSAIKNPEKYQKQQKLQQEYQNKKIQEELTEIQKEKEFAEASQRASEPWAIKYSTHPCPYCGHYKVRYAKWEDKSVSIAFWGIASSKIGKDYKCEHCKKMW